MLKPISRLSERLYALSQNSNVTSGSMLKHSVDHTSASSLPEPLSKVWHFLVPLQDAKIPIIFSLHDFPYEMLLAFPLAFLMAHFARRSGSASWLARLALFPFAFAACVRFGFAYYFPQKEFNAHNFGLGMVAITAATKVIECAISPKGILKEGEIAPGVLAEPAQNGAGSPTKSPSSPPPTGTDLNGTTPPPALNTKVQRSILDGPELFLSLRGIGWNFGTGSHLYVPPEWRDTSSRSTWVLQTLRSCAWYFLCTDMMETGLKQFPGLGTPEGGSMFAYGRNAWEKYSISFLIEMMTGFGLIVGFTLVYQLISVFGVVVLRQKPSQWPPLFVSPWSAPSLHEFWGKRWHQLLRQTFFIMGGKPLALVFGSTGLVIGTFLASGFYHSWALYAMGLGSDYSCVTYFILQGVGMTLERVIRKTTGMRMKGLFGIVWVWAWTMGGGQICSNAWHTRGVFGQYYIPEAISPARRIVLPVAIGVLKTLNVV